jgi:hypothetical protein
MEIHFPNKRQCTLVFTSEFVLLFCGLTHVLLKTTCFKTFEISKGQSFVFGSFAGLNN